MRRPIYNQTGEIMAQGRPYQAYKNASVQTSSQKQMVVMLYDGMHRFLDRAAQAIEEKDIEVAHNNLQKTGKILLELLSTLREDKGGEVSANLKKIYVYCYESVVVANLKKDVAMVRDIQMILNNLREGWKSIVKQTSNSGSTRLTGGIRITG